MGNDNLKYSDVCSKLKILIEIKYDENHEQDKILLDYLKHFHEHLSISIKDNNIINTMAQMRKFVFYFDQLIKRLPPRAPNDFWAHFFNKKWCGQLFDKSLILYNEIVNSDLFKDMHDITAILDFAKTDHCLNISFMTINLGILQDIYDIHDIKHLSIENTNVIINGKEEFLFQSTRVNFIEYLCNLKDLETINLSSNNFQLISKNGRIDDDKIIELGEILSKLRNLRKLDLSSNQIDDDILIYLFSININGNLIRDAFPSLTELNLSCNFIRFVKYHQKKIQAEKLFLDALCKRNIRLKLAFNHIHIFDEEKHEHIPSSIFDQCGYPNIYIGEPSNKIRTESLINSDYMLDEKNSLVVIADHISTEHAQILSEVIDENRQHYVLKYHLRENPRSEKCCGTQVVIEMAHGGNYLSFIKYRATKYRFGTFYIIKKTDLEKLENKVIHDAKIGIDASLYKLHFSCCGSALNCFRYCLNIVQEFIDKSVSQPLISLPRWYLNIIPPEPPSYGRLCFETIQKIGFSSKHTHVIPSLTITLVTDNNYNINSVNGMHTLPTKGNGDCAFHAIFGEFNGKKYICNDVTEKRKEISSRIRNCINDPDLYNLVKEAIRALIMENKPTNGGNITRAQMQYKQYINDNQKQLQAIWDKLSLIIKKNTNIVEFIDKFCKEYCDKKNISLQSLTDIQKFQICLNESGNILNRMFRTIPELDKAFKQYNDESTVGFYWEQYCTNQDFINEYADFIEKSGNWLIPAELCIIGHVYNITIDFYSKDPTKHNSSPQKYDIFNPGKSHTVSVCFNGIDHYERLENKEFKEKLLILSTQKTKVELKKPKMIEYLRAEIVKANGYTFEVVRLDEYNLQIICIQSIQSEKKKTVTLSKCSYAFSLIIKENKLDDIITLNEDLDNDKIHLTTKDSTALDNIIDYLQLATDKLLTHIPLDQSFFRKNRNTKVLDQKYEINENSIIEVLSCHIQ